MSTSTEFLLYFNQFESTSTSTVTSILLHKNLLLLPFFDPEKRNTFPPLGRIVGRALVKLCSKAAEIEREEEADVVEWR